MEKRSSLVFLCLWVLISYGAATDPVTISSSKIYPVAERGSSIVFVTTLGGDILALDEASGSELWKFGFDNTFENGKEFSAHKDVYITDPRDGTIYKYNEDGSVTKLGVTIPKMVEASPFSSDDGTLYIGSKVSSVVALNRYNGALIKEFKTENIDDCPNVASNILNDVVLISRTKYFINVFDSQSGALAHSFQHFEYSPPSNTLLTKTRPSLKNDRNILITSTEKTLYLRDKVTGKSIWSRDLESPPVSVFASQEGRSIGKMILIPMSEKIQRESLDAEGSVPSNLKRLRPSVKVMEHRNGIFALTSYEKSAFHSNSVSLSDLIEPKNVPYIGRQRNAQLLLEGGSSSCLPSSSDFPECLSGGQLVVEPSELEQTNAANNVQVEKNQLWTFVYATFMAISVLGFNWFLNNVMPKPAQDKHKSPSRKSSLTVTLNEEKDEIISNDLKTSGITNSQIEEMITGKEAEKEEEEREQERKTFRDSEDNLIIGKLKISKEVLGHGSHGTCVFKGEFEGRPVAVKRLLKQFYDVADHEIKLLQHSDDHSNVVRYFCSESDEEFRYIGLELCKYSLADMIDEWHEQPHEQTINLLKELITGIRHLHQVNIVHRDLKPHNVLVTFRGKAVISDFGLCKKLKDGQSSFATIRSGTSGWVAPEILNDSYRMTKSVDIFSAGCIFYFMLSGGDHPFGDSFERDLNIRKGEYNLGAVRGEPEAEDLIESMICDKPEKRLRAEEVLCHPFFWDCGKRLQFLMDVSDRIEKEDLDSDIVQDLEYKCGSVIGSDWREYVEKALLEDLKSFRRYNFSSLRDMLRAMRNKKHHYREASKELSMLFGSMPEGFWRYWEKRFPRLLMHVYFSISFGPLRREELFEKYFK